MKKLISCIFCFLILESSGFSGTSTIGHSGAQVGLLLPNEQLKAVYLEDSQYIEMLSKIGNQEPVIGVGDLNFDSNIWIDSLVVEQGIPLIRFFDENDQELYFIGSSTLIKNFSKIETPAPSDSFAGGSTIQPDGKVVFQLSESYSRGVTGGGPPGSSAEFGGTSVGGGTLGSYYENGFPLVLELVLIKDITF